MTPPANHKRIAEILLSSASEDRFGLYEAIWEINSAFANERLGWKYDVAREALKHLHEKGLIEFERVATKSVERRSTRIDDSDVAELLDDPVNWYPEYDGTCVVFTCTEAGLKKYFGGG